jgi:hypothetical protein
MELRSFSKHRHRREGGDSASIASSEPSQSGIPAFAGMTIIGSSSDRWLV